MPCVDCLGSTRTPTVHGGTEATASGSAGARYAVATRSDEGRQRHA